MRVARWGDRLRYSDDVARSSAYASAGSCGRDADTWGYFYQRLCPPLFLVRLSQKCTWPLARDTYRWDSVRVTADLTHRDVISALGQVSVLGLGFRV